MLDIDWRRAFLPTTSAFEVIVRGTLVYLVIFALLRVVLKREAGALSVADLLVIVLIADAAQNAMTAGYFSLTDGLILVATIIFWDYALDWLAFRFPRLRRFVRPPPLLLVRDGHIEERNLRRELISEDELYGFLRERGAEDLSRVKRAYLESDGRISVILQPGERPSASDRRST